MSAVAPPFPYYGGKRKLAPWITDLMPTHDGYIEPFFGSGAVLFSKRPARREIVNDADGEIVNFFRALREHPTRLAASCRLTPYARDEHADKTPPTNDLDRARRFYAKVGQSFSHGTGNSGWACGSGRASGNRARSFQSNIDRFNQIADRLANVVIENCDAADVIRRYATESDVVYCDPPYVHDTRGEPEAYACEMSDDDHRNLAETLHETKATVLVSGYDNTLYRELFDGWHTETQSTHSTVASDPGMSERVETIWANRKLNTGRLW